MRTHQGTRHALSSRRRRYRVGGLALAFLTASAGVAFAEAPESGKTKDVSVVFQEALEWFGGRSSPASVRRLPESDFTLEPQAAQGVKLIDLQQRLNSLEQTHVITKKTLQQLQEQLAHTEVARIRETQKLEVAKTQIEQLTLARDQQGVRLAEFREQLEAAHQQNQMFATQFKRLTANNAAFGDQLKIAQTDFTKAQSLWRLEREQLNATLDQQEEQFALFKGQLAETEYHLLLAEQAQISFKERFVECRGRLEARGAELIGREAALPTSTPGTLEAAEPIPWDESDTFRW